MSEADADVVFLRGEIDLASRAAVEEILLSAHRVGALELVLDLSGVTFMDSTGIHLLRAARQRATRSGYRLRLRNVPDHVRRLFDMAGLAPVRSAA